MRAISGISWDASKSNLLQVYRTTIRSVLDYGCEVIDLGCNQITDTYDKLQYQALKICCGGMKGTSASSLQVKCGELPLDLRRKKLMANHALGPISIKTESVKTKYFISGRKSKSQARLHFKMKKRGETTPYEKVESLLPADLLGGIEEETPTIPPWRLRKPVIDTSNLSFAADNPLRMLVAKEMIEDLQESLLCYTVASKTTDNKAGIGIYIPKENVNISLRTSSHNCISSIEQAAIEDCIFHVKDFYRGETFDIGILSDSLSALEALKDRDINRILNIISEIQESSRKVTLVWVPTAGYQRLSMMSKGPWPATSSNSGKPDGSLTQESQHHTTIEKLVSTKNKVQCASRRKEILISKLRIGKCALNQHLFLLKHHPDGKCQVCPQENENVRHFLMECPTQSVLREEIRTRTNLSEMSSMLSNPATDSNQINK